MPADSRSASIALLEVGQQQPHHDVHDHLHGERHQRPQHDVTRLTNGPMVLASGRQKPSNAPIRAMAAEVLPGERSV